MSKLTPTMGVISLVFLSILSPLAWGQPMPLSASFPLASGVSDVGTSFDVAINADHFVLVWTDEPQLRAQRFAFDGSPIGSEIIVTSDNTSNSPSVTLRANGEFTVQWPEIGGQALYARTYRADGTPLSDAFVVIRVDYISTYDNDIAVTHAGRLISGFVKPEFDASFFWSLQNATFDADGGNFVTDTLFSEDGDLQSRLAGNAENGFVQLGEHLTNPFGAIDFSAHRLDRDGRPIGNRFAIPTEGAERNASCVSDLALSPDGSLVVVWRSRGPAFEEELVFAQTIGADNLPIGEQRQLSAHTAGAPCPSIAHGQDGSYLVVWSSVATPPSSGDDSIWGTFGRQLGPDGIPMSDTFRINDIAPRGQSYPIVRTAPNGTKFLVAWNQTGGTHFELQARLFSARTACTPSETVACFGAGGRFRVEIDWSDFQGNEGSGQLVPDGQSESSGLFFFFNEENWELLIKVLDACNFNDRFWVFAAASTNVEYRLRVTDMETGVERIYTNPLGVSSPAITDTDAFPCP